MAAVESIGTSSEIEGQYEKHEKFVVGDFCVLPFYFFILFY